jgi:hypothetical protein
MTVSELPGRLAVARLITRDFTSMASGKQTVTAGELLEWAHRINTALAKLIVTLDDALLNKSVKLISGAVLSARDLDTVIAALDDAAGHKMLLDAVTAQRYRILSASLNYEGR